MRSDAALMTSSWAGVVVGRRLFPEAWRTRSQDPKSSANAIVGQACCSFRHTPTTVGFSDHACRDRPELALWYMPRELNVPRSRAAKWQSGLYGSRLPAETSWARVRGRGCPDDPATCRESRARAAKQLACAAAGEVLPACCGILQACCPALAIRSRFRGFDARSPWRAAGISSAQRALLRGGPQW